MPFGLLINPFTFLQAESDFLRAEKKKDDARKRGEDTWMLPSVDARLKQVRYIFLG